MDGESRFFTANGLRLHYLDWGNRGAPAVICVHGFRGNGHAFDGPARRLSGRFRVIAVDVRGRGESEWSKEGAYEMADYCADLSGLVAELGLERFRLIGTSMGGRIGMVYAKEHGDRLERLVLNDIGPDNEAGGDRITAEAGSTPAEFGSLDAVLAYRRQTFPAAAGLPNEEQRVAALTLYREVGSRWVAKSDPEFLRQRALHGAKGVPQAWETLSRLECPTLVVWGTASDVLSEGQAARMVSVLKRGELVRVPGVGHAPSLNEAEAARALDEFL